MCIYKKDMEMNVDTQWILLDQTSYIGKFGHFFKLLTKGLFIMFDT